MVGRKKTQGITPPAPVKVPKRATKALPAPPEEFPWTLDLLARAIRESAYYLWEKEDRPEGRDLEFWVRSEKEFLSAVMKKPRR